MKDVRKGFLFYIELEKREIRKAKASHRARKLLGKAEQEEESKFSAFREILEEERQMFKSIYECTLDRNEWLEEGQAQEEASPFTPIENDAEESKTRRSQNQERELEEEEE